MTAPRSRRPRLLRSAVLAVLLALCAAATANADITGRVTTPAGQPVPGAFVRAAASDGSLAGADTTDANGAYSLFTGSRPAPFGLSASFTDRCRESPGDELTATGGPVPDGAVANLVLDPYPFCATDFPPSSAAPPTGFADAPGRRVLSKPGGLTYLHVLAPSDAEGLTVRLADGTSIGTSENRDAIPVTAPAAPYDGPINLTYTSDGAPFQVPLGTLTSTPIAPPAPPRGPFDLAAIVDVSGSMLQNDPSRRRTGAVQLLVDLASPGDRIAAVGFDNGFRPIFPRTAITSSLAVKARLKRQAAARIGEFGGTDYNTGIRAAFDALTAAPLNPQVPKGAIFLTDGGHNAGVYDNAHLRFAFNGTGRPWPICVVRLGTQFNAVDIARLKRIAGETGGQYIAAPSNAQLESLYFQCRGKAAGEATLLRTSQVFRVGRARTYARPVKRGQSKATFFVTWGNGRYALALTQPGAKRPFTRSQGKRVRLIKSKTFAYFQVTNPKPGRWRLKVTRLKTGSARDRATTTVSVLPRKR